MAIKHKHMARDQRHLRDLIDAPIREYRRELTEKTLEGVSLRQHVEGFWALQYGTPITPAMAQVIEIEDGLIGAMRDGINLAPTPGSA